MKYICLVYHEEEKMASVTDAELERVIGDCMAYIDQLDQSGHHVLSSGLQSHRVATTLRRQNGKLTLTDGPFAETKEILAGFTIIEARDLNEAIQIASKFPNGAVGTVEVRPAMDPTADLSDPHDRRVAAAIMRAAQSAANCETEKLATN